ncbi:HNH endonuclease [Novosphingobium sp. Chol11]|uniref:HNH endonuclease n=1 Tax=Novosphingobium sp. Chol11 TaxID=1385763 RepID=UPI0025CEB964|nr:HNH endonuclease [Novosphingobium sp. Chol11]
MSDNTEPRRRWTEEETLLSLYLYLQLPFGKLHSKNPEIIQLAAAINRSSNSVAMKLCNFASLDPKITESGRKGLDGASKLDRQVYAKFSQDWNALVFQASELWNNRIALEPPELSTDDDKVKEPKFNFRTYEGASTSQVIVNQRIGQGFFRRAVMANFEEQCCITGISEPRLLVASHIRPWAKDIENRHNPANGLLLSGTFDRAFDSGLISVDQNLKVRVARNILENENLTTREYFSKYDGSNLLPSCRFDLNKDFLEWHMAYCF